MPTKSRLTLRQIISKGGKFRELGAQYVNLTKFKTGYTPDGYAYAACQSYSTHRVTKQGYKVVNHTRQRYITVIKFMDARLHCSLSCSCDDFKYTWETVLNKKGAAELEFSNGEDPSITNPFHHIGICKHLIALWWKIEPRVEAARIAKGLKNG